MDNVILATLLQNAVHSKQALQDYIRSINDPHKTRALLFASQGFEDSEYWINWYQEKYPVEQPTK